jgi:hypothetical protein
MVFKYSISSAKYQVFLRLYFLTLLIPEDGHWEGELSLALDRALVALEGAE